MPSVVSHFRINDSVQRSTETVVILKSTRENFEKIKETYDSMHTYENPCLISMEILDGSQKFLDWIKDQV